uniref:Uncharacterized protein n=1 Tax=viral metagenome TaxID=1070528 RepID=A0A6M3L1W8_9ZZZZ
MRTGGIELERGTDVLLLETEDKLLLESSISSALEAEQKELSVKPSLPWVFTSGATELTYDTDRILRCEHSEAHDSHKAELILQNSDGEFTAKDLKGYSVEPKWGLITSAGSETSETAPLWVHDMTLHSVRGQLIARLACIGMPDRLARDKAQSTYLHHWSSTKTVKDLITEVADNSPVSEELTEELYTVNLSDHDGYIDLDDTEVEYINSDGGVVTARVDGVGQRISIPNREVTKIAFRLKKTGEPAGTNVTFRIYDVENDIELASKTFPIASITTSPTWCEATLDTPVTIDKEITWQVGEPTGGVYLYVDIPSASGTATDYVSVYYYDADWRSGQHIFRVYSAGTPAPNPSWETKDQDCAYRYKYNFAGIEAFDTSAESYDVIYDDEDSLIDTYVPADAFNIPEGEARLDTIDKLLGFTGCERMFKADSKIHVLTPTTSGVVYDSEYSLASGEHGFFSKANREALVNPNKIVVKSLEGDATQYEGSATSAASFALMPILGSPIRTRLANDAQGAAIAAAYISRLEVASQRGSCSVPMNVGAELWDYVKVNAVNAQDTYRVGNSGYLKRIYNPRASNPADRYTLTFGFGGVARKGVPGTKTASLRPDISSLQAEARQPYVTWGFYDMELYPRLDLIADLIDELQYAVFGKSRSKLGEGEGILIALRNILTALGFYGVDIPTEDEVAEKLVGFLKNVVSTARSDVTASRAKDTNYTNGTKTRICVILFEMSDNDYLIAKSDTNATPTTVVGYSPYDVVVGRPTQMIFIVAPSENYRVEDVGTVTIEKWLEYDLALA